MGSSGVPGFPTGDVTVNGNLTVTGRAGIGTAPIAGVQCAVIPATNGTIAHLVRGAAGQNVDYIMFQGSGTGVEAEIVPGGGFKPGASGAVGGQILYGAGAPAAGLGNNGDIYCRTDGAALSTIYQKRAGAWVGIV